MVENTGSFTLSEDSLSISFNHGLPSEPTIIAVWTPDPTISTGSSSPTTFRSIVATVIIFKTDEANCHNARGYNSSGSKVDLLSFTSFSIDSTSVTITSSSTAYKFKANKEYKWRAIV